MPGGTKTMTNATYSRRKHTNYSSEPNIMEQLFVAVTRADGRDGGLQASE